MTRTFEPCRVRRHNKGCNVDIHGLPSMLCIEAPGFVATAATTARHHPGTWVSWEADLCAAYSSMACSEAVADMCLLEVMCCQR